MDHIFLSDVHLGAFPDEENLKIESDLIELVNYCEENKIQIHILGDLFDYWMEYPNYVPELGKMLLDSLARFNKNVHPITYILGNHDNWTRGYFDELGFNTRDDYFELILDGKLLFLHHGDGLAGPEYNFPRPLFHQIIRSKWFIKLYQFIFPPEAGLDLMKRFSTISKNSPDIEPQQLNQWTKSFLMNSKYDFVICGHDHIARKETFPFGTYINSGTFFEDRTVVYYTNGNPKLVTWSADDKKLIPSNKTFENENIL